MLTRTMDPTTFSREAAEWFKSWVVTNLHRVQECCKGLGLTPWDQGRVTARGRGKPTSAARAQAKYQHNQNQQLFRQTLKARQLRFRTVVSSVICHNTRSCGLPTCTTSAFIHALCALASLTDIRQVASILLALDVALDV